MKKRTNKFLIHKNTKQLVTLYKKQQLTHNVYKLTFKLPGENQTLGLPVGKHIRIQYLNKLETKWKEHSQILHSHFGHTQKGILRSHRESILAVPSLPQRRNSELILGEAANRTTIRDQWSQGKVSL